ncbi:MAG TPA: membrane bound O-acyl transferase family-domain-containing protein [Blastocatellia bacterium]|nr:membrane bound O-acyl transferase family-domain-containing protein [Blastocatellia bacterium]
MAAKLQTAKRAIPAYQGWAPLIVFPAAVLILTPGTWPRWAFMWLLAFVIFAGCKWLTWRRTPAPDAKWWQHAGYLLAWPGLDAKAFLSAQRLPKDARPSAREWLSAFIKIIIGVFTLWIIAPRVSVDQVILRGWLGMIGLIFILHLGSLHLLSCVWRSVGIDARPLMKSPLLSTSVSEFWGRRWNTAFRDLTHRFLFKPLSSSIGPKWAIIAGFIFSGLVHDLVISVPARGGYGGPTIFFVAQSLAIFIERSSFGRTIGLMRGWRGWLFTMAALILPAYGLFHPPFIRNIIIPFLQALGALKN